MVSVERQGVVRRDLVVIGASAGGIDALSRVLSQLPASFPAAICIVQHQMQTGGGGHLVSILQRASSLPVSWAIDRAEIAIGTVLLAPPAIHLMIHATGDALETHLVSGARENFARPSIDRLFRSAAGHAGSRVVGVLLSGMLHDGVAGLHDIQRAGGLCLAQDPEDAEFPELPGNAVRTLTLDGVHRLDAMGAALVCHAGTSLPALPTPPDLSTQRALDLGPAPPAVLETMGPQSPIACPECRGPLWRVEGAFQSYRCYNGHVATLQGMASHQSDEVEQSLWAAVRAMQERAFTFDRMAEDMRGRATSVVAEEYAQRASASREHAERIRALVLGLQLSER